MSYTTHETISLNLHFLVKERLLADPDKVLAIAKSNLSRWKKRYTEEPSWMSAWREILSQGILTVLPVLEGTDERSILLKSSSPFTGIVSQKERFEIIRNAKS